MDTVENSNRAGKPWSPEEDEQLVKEYTVDTLSLLELCEKHNRKPGGITSRLKYLNLIDERVAARGYSDYLKSDLYKEMLQKKEEKNSIVKAEEKTQNNSGMFGLDKSMYPSRMGKVWDEDEVLKLLKSIQKKRTIKEIAADHQRTEGGITSKLKDLAADYYICDNRDIAEIKRFTGLSEQIILEAIDKKQYRNSLRKEKVSKTDRGLKINDVVAESDEPSLKEIMVVMKDLQQKMAFILEMIQ
jgi:hypothetical protein